jgi:hypothetical protein
LVSELKQGIRFRCSKNLTVLKLWVITHVHIALSKKKLKTK